MVVDGVDTPNVYAAVECDQTSGAGSTARVDRSPGCPRDDGFIVPARWKFIRRHAREARRLSLRPGEAREADFPILVGVP